MIDTKIKGNLTEMECMAAFMELGFGVSIPFGEDSRYDFIADVNDKLYKIQCKTVRQSGSNTTNWSRTKYEPNEVDFFATSYNKKCYLVPLNECSNEKTLRIRLPKNNQTKGISFLKDYELSEVLKTL